MPNTLTTLHDLRTQAKGYWAERALAQCAYACKLSLVKQGKYDALIAQAVAALRAAFRQNGALTKTDCERAEAALAPLAADAKSYGVSLIGHAHIDMNWMWSYSETVAITLETFRTMLRLLAEYPQFTFAQSQASVYRIVEKHEPQMLDEIRKYIKEGRWEVSASHWVEADKNCSNGEAQARHLLYTKQYLSKLLDIDPATLNLDFEPDTFGHNVNVPEILTGGGVKYYYHCRGQETDHLVYRWRAPSGAEILVNREAFWYNGTVDADYALTACELCEKLGISEILRVYGVGDHGGGPTRRDIERVLEYAKWPIFPRFRFGTYREYFALLEEKRDSFPLFEKEINSIFTGCYTTQTRIKLANKLGEARLSDADAYAALAQRATPDYLPANLFEPWENVLFNQFHDILPGSGVIDTREYAMGIFHQSLAQANSQSARAMRAVAENIDTSALPMEDEADSAAISEGAGVGFSVESYGLPKTERGRGKNRILHFFNPSAVPFCGAQEFTIWDWPGDMSRFALFDSAGNRVTHQLLREGERNPNAKNYWGHEFAKLLADISVPPLGWATYTVRELELENGASNLVPGETIEKPFSFVLENEALRVVLDTQTLKVTSLVDKETERELIGPGGAGLFKIMEENGGMTAWRIGRYTAIEDLQTQVRVKWVEPGLLRKAICFTTEFGNGSRFDCTVSLNGNASCLDFDLKCDWLEVGDERFIPQLAFHVPLGYDAAQGKYAVPMGILTRDAIDLDVAAQGIAAAIGNEPRGLYLAAQGKYGFRLTENRLSLTLLHSSVGPDPYPELGEHHIRFSLGVSETDNAALAAVQAANDHPVSYLSGTVHAGTLPLTAQSIALAGDSVSLSAAKPAEDGRGQILRLYETEGKACRVTIGSYDGIREACLTDILEVDGEALSVADGKACCTVKPYSVTNIRIV